MAAKGKHKKKARQNDAASVTTPQFTTVTRPVRGTVIQTFTSTGSIAIPGRGQATPYPSAITVSGLTNGTITDVDLILNDLTHGIPADVDVLLSSSDGRRALVMSDVGDGDSAIDIDLTLDDEAALALPVHRLSNGTFRPTDVNADPDTFTAPAPSPDGSVALSTFDGANPNGTWQVWVMDNVTGQGGTSGVGGSCASPPRSMSQR